MALARWYSAHRCRVRKSRINPASPSKPKEGNSIKAKAPDALISTEAFEEFYEPPEITSEDLDYPPDPKTQQVKRLIIEKLGQEPKRVYFQRQLEVIYEKQFFHWVTDRAIKELQEEGKIIVDFYPIPVGTYRDAVKMITSKSNRYYKREATRIGELVTQYSNPRVTQDTGLWGQELFKVAYGRYGFHLIAEDVNEFRGERWLASDKNIDFIVEKKGHYFGCEVKNTLGYMDKREWMEKLRMCKFFGVVPVFILRYSPTVWNYEIFKSGGLVQLFEAQVFSPGRAELVNQLRDVLELPVMVSRKIPSSIMDRFEKLLEKRVFREKKL